MDYSMENHEKECTHGIAEHNNTNSTLWEHAQENERISSNTQQQLRWRGHRLRWPSMELRHSSSRAYSGHLAGAHTLARRRVRSPTQQTAAFIFQETHAGHTNSSSHRRRRGGCCANASTEYDTTTGLPSADVLSSSSCWEKQSAAADTFAVYHRK